MRSLIDFCRYADAIRQPLLGAGRCEQRAYVDRPRPWARTGSARPRPTDKAKSVEDGTAAHRQRASRAVSVLREMAADAVEIAQSTFRLGEVRMPPSLSGSREPEAEYQAVTTFELKIDSGGRRRWLDHHASSGHFQVRNLRFGLADNNPGANTTSKNAVADARERAAAYAQAAGVQLGDIVKIEDTETQGPVLFAAKAPAIRSVEVIPPGNLTLTASATITWRISAKL